MVGRGRNALSIKHYSSLMLSLSLFPPQTKELSKVNIEQTGQILEVEDEDLAKVCALILFNSSSDYIPSLPPSSKF